MSAADWLHLWAAVGLVGLYFLAVWLGDALIRDIASGEAFDEGGGE